MIADSRLMTAALVCALAFSVGPLLAGISDGAGDGMVRLIPGRLLLTHGGMGRLAGVPVVLPAATMSGATLPAVTA